MNRVSKFLAVTSLFVLASHRLPAPIAEEATPVPKPKRAEAPKPKPKPERTSKPAAAPSRSFAGTWIGNVVANDSNGNSGSYSYQVSISDDEKTVLVNESEFGKSPSGPPFPASCTRFGAALSWSFSDASGTSIYTMQLNSDGTANFRRDGRYVSEDETVTYTHTGNFSRAGASGSVQSTAAAAPQTTSAPANNGGAPVAKAVPGRPGFVYNPFDPTSRILLDVRGKPSGSKLVDPKSGKLFTVP
jgi:hypothetical protein